LFITANMMGFNEIFRKWIEFFSSITTTQPSVCFNRSILHETFATYKSRAKLSWLINLN